MKRVLAWSAVLTLASTTLACGDDGGSDTDAADASSTSGSGATTDTPTTDGPTTDTPTTTTSGGSSSTTSAEESSGSSSSGSGGADSSSSGGEEIDCDAIPEGPFAANEQFSPFSGSEDLAFNGLGGLAGKNGNELIIVDSDGNETAAYPETSMPTYGVRFTAAGDLLVAQNGFGQILQIAPDGTTTDFATGVGGVNGLYPDFDGNVWVTNFSSVQRFDAAGSPTTIVSGGDAGGANGIVYDPDRGVAFFTNYGAGRLAKVDIAKDGTPGDVTGLATVGGALFDGLALDVCGNLYAVDNGNNRIYRLMLDENADAVGDATDIVDGNMQNIANAQFGRGEGFEETSLYASGNPGVVYRLDVGVPGAPIPLP